MEMSAYHPFESAEAKVEYLAYCDEEDKKWPVVSESRMVDTSYGQTFVKISGPAGAPPLVLLPGMWTSSVTWGWVPIMVDLSECYRTYAVDNIYDYGRSVYTRTYESPDDFVNWLDELFSALELGNNINLMGLSLGGWLTSLYALRFPNRLDKVLALAPAGTVVPCAGYLTHPWAFVGRCKLTGEVILAFPGMGPPAARKSREKRSSTEGRFSRISPVRQPRLRHQQSVGGVAY